MEGKLILGGKSFDSRFILGSGKHDPNLIKACVESVGCGVITAVLRHVNTGDIKNVLNFIPENVTIVPNTSKARNAGEAIRIAGLTREMGCGNFMEIEIIHDSRCLLPDNVETLKAMRVLADEGFTAMPYMYPDLDFARDSEEAGASCIIPLGSPIGFNKKPATRGFIQIIINEIDLPMIVGTGIGKPSQAYEAMEMSVGAIVASTAIATSGDINKMAEASALAIKAGRLAHIAKPGKVLETGVDPSSPLRGFFG